MNRPKNCRGYAFGHGSTMRLPHLLLGLLLGACLVGLGTPAQAAEGPSAKVTDLAWMTGHWEGAMGNGTLEENWTEPKAGSISSLVRGTDGDALSMIELIVIEEEEGSLTLRLQQWNPGFEPRSESAQVMRLVDIGKNMVKFEATSEGGLKTLGYSSPEDGKFVISVSTAQGEFDIPLSK